MKFLVDAHLPRRLVRWLEKQGFDTTHTTDLPDANKTQDEEIIRIAELESRIIITKDSDFIQFRILTKKPDKLLLVTTGNIVNKDLLVLFHNNFSTIVELFEAGTKVVEISSEAIIAHN